jgi:hypothetical protein
MMARSGGCRAAGSAANTQRVIDAGGRVSLRQGCGTTSSAALQPQQHNTKADG